MSQKISKSLGSVFDALDTSHPQAGQTGLTHDAAKKTVTVDLAAITALGKHLNADKLVMGGVGFWMQVAAGHTKVIGGSEIHLPSGQVLVVGLRDDTP